MDSLTLMSVNLRLSSLYMFPHVDWVDLYKPDNYKNHNFQNILFVSRYFFMGKAS